MGGRPGAPTRYLCCIRPDRSRHAAVSRPPGTKPRRRVRRLRHALHVHAAVARHAAAVGPDAARLSEIWRAKQLEYSWVLSLAGRYEPFWTLTERALDHAFARCPTVDRDLREAL